MLHCNITAARVKANLFAIHSVATYLTLPYHTGKTFYRLALRPLTGPMRIPELTVRLQNPQVQYSLGSIPTLLPAHPVYQQQKLTIRKICFWGRRLGDTLLSSAGPSRNPVISPIRARVTTSVRFSRILRASAATTTSVQTWLWLHDITPGSRRPLSAVLHRAVLPADVVRC